jgi:hypothetical protein
MRILLHARRTIRNSDERQHFHAAIEGFLLGKLLVLQVHLHQLKTDREDRVQRCHRLLKNHADFVAAHASYAVVV